MECKGIILAGGKATRLYPTTKTIPKHLLLVYNKPVIYYSLSVLMLAGIKDILIITNSNDVLKYKKLLKTGKKLGLNISYALQSEPKGIADAFLVGENFIQSNRVCLILGDNIFYGHDLVKTLKESINEKNAVVFAYHVKNPQRYGVIEFDNFINPISIEEKPQNPKSNWAVTGLYFYNNEVIDIAKNLKPSERGELEITDINKEYLKRKQLTVKLLGRGYAWLDVGTFDSLIDASIFVKTIEERQGLKIGDVNEIAQRLGYTKNT